MKLKKLLALILCATMLLPLGILPSFAAEGENERAGERPNHSDLLLAIARHTAASKL